MPLGDTYVKCSFWHFLHHDVHRTSGRHGGCYAYYLRILLSQFQQGMTEHILIFLRFVRILVHDTLTSFGVEFSRSMPGGHVFLCWGIAMAFLGMQMQQLRTAHVLDLVQYAHQFLHVVPVERTEVTYVHTLKDVLLVRDGTLDGVGKTDDTLLTIVIEHTFAVQPARSLETQCIIRLVGAQIQQILLHATHRSVNRHVVVVQDDQQVVRTR